MDTGAYIENVFNVWSILAIFVIGVILYYAYRKEKIDKSAILATAICGFICLVAGGIKWIEPLILFFIVGNIFSHYKKTLKRKLGVEQEIRTWKNVFANGGAAIIFAWLYILFSYSVFLFGLIGAMACALADTSATELGQIYGKKPRLIKNLKRVPIGTPGAVSDEGFAFALLGSGIISSLLLFWGYPMIVFLICLFAGFFGSVIDSVFGCTIEKKGDVDTTHVINFLTTLAAGCLAIALYVCLVV